MTDKIRTVKVTEDYVEIYIPNNCFEKIKKKKKKAK